MRFFDVEFPEDEFPDEDDLDDGFDELRPAPWVGGVVAVELVVARSPQAAVVVRGVVAYPDGFELSLQAWVHRSVRLRGRHRELFMHSHRPGRRPVPDDLLRFGIGWPDGGRATNLDRWGRDWPDATEPAHGIEERGGGGSDREWTQDYWAWPVPGPGELRFVCEWPEFGITETSVAVGATLFVEAAERAAPVWPDDAGRSSHTTHAAMIQAHRLRSSDD